MNMKGMRPPMLLEVTEDGGEAERVAQSKNNHACSPDPPPRRRYAEKEAG